MLHRPRRRTLLALIASLALLATACGGRTTDSGAGAGTTLTVYSASGLGAWLGSQFDRFTADTGVKVELVEGGSGEVVSRLEQERADPRADLVITLPPFIQKAAQSGLLQPSDADVTGITSQLVGPAAIYVPIVDNALCFIANPGADPAPASWDDLLSPRFEGKLQYSTPGQAGDGTAMLLLLQHLMGKPRALEYLTALHANDIGPAPSTSQLQPKVNSGELLIANGDVQMNLAAINNDGFDFSIFFPAMPDGSRTTISIPYVAGVTAGSPAPDAAKDLLAFLLSDDVQETVGPEAFGIPVLDSVAREDAIDPGTPSPASLLDGVEVWEPNWTAVLGDFDYDLAAYRRATGE